MRMKKVPVLIAAQVDGRVQRFSGGDLRGCGDGIQDRVIGVDGDRVVAEILKAVIGYFEVIGAGLSDRPVNECRSRFFWRCHGQLSLRNSVA